MGFKRIIGAVTLVMVQGCMMFVGPRPVLASDLRLKESGGHLTGALVQAQFYTYTPNRVILSSTKPILLSAKNSKYGDIAPSPDFRPASYFVMNLKMGSDSGQPFRISVLATGGYRNDYVAGWFASVPEAGVSLRCV